MSFDFAAWREAVHEEVERAGREGLEEVVARTAARFRAGLNAEEVARLADELKRRHRIAGRDARAAFRVLEAYYWDGAIRRQPFRGRFKRYLAALLGYRYPDPVVEESDRVVFASPWGQDCPLLAAWGQDVERCRPFCQAHLRAGILFSPLEMMLVEAVGPEVRWEIDEVRSTPEGRCYYAISSEKAEENGGA